MTSMRGQLMGLEVLYLQLVGMTAALDDRPDYGEMRRRICRAMHVKGSFTTREIMILSDASKKYVRFVIKNLTGSCDLVRHGKRQNDQGRWETVYRLVNKNRFFVEHVRRESERRCRVPGAGILNTET